jgi:hypothetical protein
MSNISCSRFSNLSRRLAGLPQQQCLSITLIGLLAFAGSAAIGLLIGIAEPSFQDEFSYLLASDTFSHGRVTNPTHPMWMHFESIHIIHEPTYMSKYPPAQGLVLAAGQVVSGYPIVGVWMSMGLMCAAIFWMLQEWLPRRWALLGGFLAIIHPELGIAGYWAQSYWGGAVAGAGGALVLGGLRSLMHKKKVTSALILGVGVAILANSRPYEGLLLSLPVAVTLLYWLGSRNGPPVSVSISKILIPLLLVLGLTAAAMAFYNFRITGDVFRMPYQVHEETYAILPIFIWQDLRPTPTYYHQTLREFHTNYGLSVYNEKQSLSGFIKLNVAAWMMYFLLAASVLSLPLVGMARTLFHWMLRNRWGRFATITYVTFAMGMTVETYLSLHYFAPIVPLNYFFILQAMRLWRRRNPRLAKPMLWVVPSLTIAVLLINIDQTIKNHDELTPHFQRARLLAKLKQQDGRHLILVKYGPYGPNRAFEHEWVYNEADIDGSKVVWARDMDLKENCQLIDYFNDRRVWSLEIDRDDVPVKVNPFPAQRYRF